MARGAALRLYVTGKVAGVGSGAHGFGAGVKLRRQVLAANTSTFAVDPETGQAEGMKLGMRQVAAQALTARAVSLSGAPVSRSSSSSNAYPSRFLRHIWPDRRLRHPG